MRMPAVMAPPPSSTPLTAPARPPAGGPALQAAQALALWHRVLVVGLNRSLPDLTTRQFALFRSEEHTSELQSLMRISYAVFCLKKKRVNDTDHHNILNNY